MKKIIIFYIFIIIVGNISSCLYANNNIKSNFFIENKGQWLPKVRFFTKIGGMGAWITDNGIVYDFYKIVKEKKEIEIGKKIAHSHRIGNIVKMNFVDCKQNYLIGSNKLSGYNNYFIGNDKTKWASKVPLFSEVKINELYNGISARFYYDDNMLRYDFIADANADISQIKFRFEGCSGLSVNNIGELVINTNVGEVRVGKIFAYQIDNGSKKEVLCHFEMLDKSTVKFNVENYNKSLPLIIDPLTYSTFIGANNDDEAYGLALDGSNNVYISGYSYSPDFPTTSGVYDDSQNGSWEVFVCKLNRSGSSLDYSTYIGGSSPDYATSIALDGSNNIYVTGYTSSSDFPTSETAYDTSYNGNIDLFVCKFNSIGSSLVYSTYIGGSNSEHSNSIVLDGLNNAYITGYTTSSNFPTSESAFDKIQSGNSRDIFVARLNSTGSTLDYSTYIGGNKVDEASSLAIDGSNNIYITGFTYSSDFPTTENAYDTSHNGGFEDGFVCKLSSDFSSLVYSTYLGAHNQDLAYSIALDHLNNAYVAGYTNSSDFPITSNAYDSSQNDSWDVFVSKLNSNGSALEYSTFIGGSDYDEAYSIVLDQSNNAYITGFTNSSDFPTSKSAYDTSYNGNKDVFLCKINSSGSSLDYSTFIGGGDDDESYNIDLDQSNNIFITGRSKSSDFPTNANAYDTVYNGHYDVFVTKLNLVTLSISSLSKSSFCVADVFDIPFKVTGNFDLNNKFIAQLSDKNGDFDDSLILASLKGTNSGVFKNVKIPQELSSGTKYRIRIVSTNPAVIGSDNGENLSIYTLPIPKIISGQSSVCSGGVYSYSSNKEDGTDYKWSVSSGTISGSDIGETVDVIWGSNGMGKLTLTQTNTNGCMDSVNMDIAIYPLPKPQIVSGQDSVCFGSDYSYSSNKVYSINYKWLAIGGEISGADDEQIVNITWTSQDTGLLILTQTDEIGCRDSVSMLIIIKPIPNVNYTAPITKVCIDEPEFKLQGGIPEGGVYTGRGVKDGKFNAKSAGDGEHTITYTYKENACENSATQVITVNPLPPKPTISEDNKRLKSSFATTYQWYLNDIKIDEAIEQSYKPTEAGYYKVEINNENGCKNISDDFYFNPTDVEKIDLKISKISIIPNPCQVKTKINYSVDKLCFVSITITNSLGIKIIKLLNNKLTVKGQYYIDFDTSELNSGIYFCTFRIAEYIETVKMVVVR